MKCKIREFDGVNGDDSVNAIYYTADSKPKGFRMPHKLTNTEGVVKHDFKP